MMGRGMIPSSPVPVLVRLVFLCGSGLPGPGIVLRRRLGLLDEQFLLGSLDGLQGGRGRLDIDLVARQLGCQAGVLALLDVYKRQVHHPAKQGPVPVVDSVKKAEGDH